MGEGNHLSQPTAPQAINRLGVIIGGTAVVLIAGLFLMQMFRA